MTKNDQARADLAALIRSRVTVIWNVTVEEPRVEAQIAAACVGIGYPVLTWDCGAGLVDAEGNVVSSDGDPQAVLALIRERQERAVYVLRDFHAHLDVGTLRRLKNLARDLAGLSPPRSIIVLTPEAKVPPELSDLATVVDWPLPEREELAELLDRAVDVLADTDKEGNPLKSAVREGLTNGKRDAAIDAATGLTGQGAGNAYAKSLVTTKRIDPAQVSAEKKQIVSRATGLSVYDPDPRGFDAIGGLENVKGYLRRVKAALSPRARAFGLPPPKGIFLCGIPGCGKTLVAKCAGAALNLPILRLDMGAVKSKYVGESETNLRRAFEVIAAVSPCVLVADEIEKSLAGASGPQGDGGVSSDALGALLTWRQDCKESIVMVATCNDVRGLPAELTRKGRFDEVFFVDLPTARERREIIVATLHQYKRDPDAVGDLGLLEPHTRGFTGAEIAALVPDALFCAFEEGERDLTVADLITSAVGVVPMSKMQAERVAALKDWAKGRAKPASLPEAQSASAGRTLDV